MTPTRGARLKEAREGAGLSQRQVAVHYGIESGTVSRWERDETTPSVEQFEKLEKLYSVSAAWLVFGVGPKRARVAA